MSRHGRKLAIFLALPLMGGLNSATALAQALPTVGNVQMPPVTPQQADQFFATRVVPPSSVPALPATPSSQPLQSVNVDPILGHDLPSDATTAAGLPRADFAIAKPDGEKKRRPVAAAAAVNSRAPGATVIQIQEPPPIIGKP